MSAYYNELDPFAVQWLRQLIKNGHLPAGEVDDRDIKNVSHEDLRGFTQCHFFAGIGGWAYALRLADWPDERPAWTGSCPCQPFSSAGKQGGKLDDRHLWPAWLRLIKNAHPPTIFGEQVSSAIAHGWLDDVYQGLEDEGYAVGSAVLPACSVGAPHKRDRLWFVAHADSQGLPQRQQSALGTPLRDAQPERLYSPRREWWTIEPALGRVANGISRRMGKLRGYGNAIVPQVAAEFIKATM